MLNDTVVQFLDWPCRVDLSGRYSNGRRAIRLFDANDGGPVATASVNLPEIDLAEDEIAIKTYSENTGILEVLLDGGVLAPPHREVSNGFAIFPVCRLRD